MHGGVGLEGGKGQVTALGLESDRISDDVPQPKPSLQFTVVNVAIFAQINVEQAIEHEALKMANETGRDHRDVTLLRHDTSLNVVELQAGVVSHHRTCVVRNEVGMGKITLVSHSQLPLSYRRNEFPSFQVLSQKTQYS